MQVCGLLKVNIRESLLVGKRAFGESGVDCVNAYTGASGRYDVTPSKLQHNIMYARVW